MEENYGTDSGYGRYDLSFLLAHDPRLIRLFMQLMYTDYAWSGLDYGRMTGTR